MVVVIIDTGVNYNHVDLAANIWTNPAECSGGVGTCVADGVDDDGNGFVDDFYGWDFVNNDNDPMDDNKHGTHVAGTIGAVGNNGVGVTGVNWNVQIMALKFLDRSGSGTLADAIEAINYATMMRRDFGVNLVVTNNSWGGGGFSRAMFDAIQASGEANMLFVAAAGNNGGVGAILPARYNLDNIISVAATDHTDALASFSNRGNEAVDLGAPGVDVLSTMRKNYGTLSGTSMASPHVAGVAALAWDVDPAASYADIRDAIFAGVDPFPSLSGLTVTGGRLNAYTTLVIAEALLGNATTIWIDDVSQLEGDAGTSDFVFTVSRVGDASAQMTVDWATADGTATIADNDYNFSSGTLTFDPGVSGLTITVQVNGDTAEEAHETFLVNLTNLQGGTTPALIVDAQGLGTILNDDTTVSISDAAVTEGDDRVVFLDEFVPDGNTGLNDPTALEYGPQDADGDGKPDHLFVVSFNEQYVLRFDAQTGSQGQVFVPVGSGGMIQPNHALFGPDGNLYLVDSEGHAVFRFDGLTGAPLPAPGKTGATFISAGDGGLLGSRGIVFDAAGDAYVTSMSTGEVIKYQGPSGANPWELIGVFVTAGSGGLIAPCHLVFGPDGHLYVTSYGTDAVLRFDKATGAPLPAAGKTAADFVTAGSGGLDLPFDLQFADHDGDGMQDLFVSSRGTNEILRYDGATGDFIEVYVSSGSGGLVRPTDLQFTPDGNLLVASSRTINAVLRYGVASQAVFTVSLSSPVGQTVTMDVFTADVSATANVDYVPIPAASPRTVTFSPNDTSLLIFIPTLDDSEVELSETFSVNLSNLTGANPGDLTGVGTILDNEPPPPPPGITVSPTSGLVTTEGGSTANFDVVLDTQPTADVTIGISSGDTTEGTPGVASLTFTSANWNTPQTVTVTGVDDALTDGDVAYAIVTAAATSSDLAYNGLDASDVSVTNLDNETPSGNANDMYVWDIAFDSRNRGKGGAKHDERVMVTIRRDSDADGVSEATDAVVAGETVTVVVGGPTGGTFSGTTDAAGVFTSGWLSDVPDGTYTADVTAVTDGTFTWNALLDVEADETHAVPHGAASSAIAAASESTAASLDASTSGDASADDAALVSIAAPLPSTDTGSISSTESEPAAATTDDSDAVDAAIADFDAGPLDDALLEDLAVALVG